ncbi:hypothetical protein Tcan_00919, partial [Toxocara canis]
MLQPADAHHASLHGALSHYFACRIPDLKNTTTQAHIFFIADLILSTLNLVDYKKVSFESGKEVYLWLVPSPRKSPYIFCASLFSTSTASTMKSSTYCISFV